MGISTEFSQGSFITNAQKSNILVMGSGAYKITLPENEGLIALRPFIKFYFRNLFK